MLWLRGRLRRVCFDFSGAVHLVVEHRTGRIKSHRLLVGLERVSGLVLQKEQVAVDFVGLREIGRQVQRFLYARFRGSEFSQCDIRACRQAKQVGVTRESLQAQLTHFGRHLRVSGTEVRQCVLELLSLFLQLVDGTLRLVQRCAVHHRISASARLSLCTKSGNFTFAVPPGIDTG